MAPSDVDPLFQLPLAEFTAARNALAARLKKEGRADRADEVKRLAKPSVSAWVVNQLFWRHRKQFDRLLASGEGMRRAQAAQLAGRKADVREALDARRDALSDLAREAAAILTRASHAPSPDMLRRITTTLEALSAYGNTPDAPPPGRLTDDVDPPGFETLAALIPASGSSRGRGPSTVIPFEKKASQKTAPPKPPTDPKEAKRLEREREVRRAAAIKEAERELREAKAAAERAEAALKKAASRVKAAESARADAERRLEETGAELTAAKQAARQVAAEAEEAAQAVSDAERGIEKARES